LSKEDVDGLQKHLKKVLNYRVVDVDPVLTVSDIYTYAGSLFVEQNTDWSVGGTGRSPGAKKDWAFGSNQRMEARKYLRPDDHEGVGG